MKLQLIMNGIQEWKMKLSTSLIVQEVDESLHKQMQRRNIETYL